MLLKQGYDILCTTNSSSSSRCQHVSPGTLTGSPSLPSPLASIQHMSGSCSAVVSTAGCISPSRSHSKVAGVICRDAPRPMWARKSPQLKAPGQSGSHLEPLITKQIQAANSVVDLEDVYNEWGGSFNYIHAAAALVKFAKLGRRGRNSRLLPLLVRKWTQFLPEARPRACANTLWACSNMSQYEAQVSTLWGPTWSAFVQHVARDMKQGQAGEAAIPQHLANSVYAAAKLRKQPAAGELQLLVQAFLQPDVLAAAVGQDIANLLWAVCKLFQLSGWQGGVAENEVQQLLGEQQLQLLETGTEQAVANVIFALAGMAAGDDPLVSKAFAQQCTRQLLGQASMTLIKGNPQHITNTMWATAELGLPSTAFAAKAVDRAAIWVPHSISRDVMQAATACALLQYRNEAFLMLLLQRASQLFQQQTGNGTAPRGKSRVMSAAEKAGFAALLAASIVQLDMQQLAGPTCKLVASSGACEVVTHPADLRRLWVFHSWLLQHQLLDGKGLTQILTEEQLDKGKHEAAVYGMGIRGAQ